MFGTDASGPQAGGAARQDSTRPSAPAPGDAGPGASSGEAPSPAFTPAWADSRPNWTAPSEAEGSRDSRPNWATPLGTDSRPGRTPPPAAEGGPPAGPGPSADPFAKPDPFTSADPFARPDPFTSADPFGRTAAFAVPAGAPDGPASRDDAAEPGRPASEGRPPGGAPHQDRAGQPGQGAAQDRAGGHLSRDPSDPNRPFVTAGQISGPKTPPPERQQELWNTVFGENYQAIGDEEELAGSGRPVWVFALAGSAVIALVGAVLWAFLAGPLASAEEESAAAATKPSQTPSPSAAAKKIGRLPKFSGDPSPVAGTLTDARAALTLPRLGAPWRLDTRPSVTTTYGFSTRQYVLAGQDSAGKPQAAQLMSGPLSPRMAKYYTSPENLSPVINAVTLVARKRFFPEGNTAKKTAQQTLAVGGLPAQLAAYEITADGQKTTVVVAAVSTGADLPSIVYMSVPDGKKELLPDINAVFTAIRTTSRG
ncbi:hypothetical protein [Planomonospora alba]